MGWIEKLINPFRFIARYHARQAVKRLREWKLLEADRAHQQSLLKAFLASLEIIQKTSSQESSSNAQALMKIAESMTAQANAMTEWMKLFQSSSAPTTSIMRDEDEIVEEGLRAGFPPHIASASPEHQLRWMLQQDDPTFAE